MDQGLFLLCPEADVLRDMLRDVEALRYSQESEWLDYDESALQQWLSSDDRLGPPSPGYDHLRRHIGRKQTCYKPRTMWKYTVVPLLWAAAGCGVPRSRMESRFTTPEARTQSWNDYQEVRENTRLHRDILHQEEDRPEAVLAPPVNPNADRKSQLEDYAGWYRNHYGWIYNPDFAFDPNCNNFFAFKSHIAPVYAVAEALRKVAFFSILDTMTHHKWVRCEQIHLLRALCTNITKFDSPPESFTDLVRQHLPPDGDRRKRRARRSPDRSRQTSPAPQPSGSQQPQTTPATSAAPGAMLDRKRKRDAFTELSGDQELRDKEYKITSENSSLQVVSSECILCLFVTHTEL